MSRKIFAMACDLFSLHKKILLAISFSPAILRTVMKIEFYAKDNYGTTHFYIVDPAVRSAVTQLTGQKTISQSHMLALKNLGFELVEVIAPRK